MTSIVFFSSLIPFLDLPLMMFKMVASERSCNCCKQSCFNSPLLISCLDRRKEWEEKEKEKAVETSSDSISNPWTAESERSPALCYYQASLPIYTWALSLYIYIVREEAMNGWGNWEMGRLGQPQQSRRLHIDHHHKREIASWDKIAPAFFLSLPPPLFLLPIHSKWPTFTIFAQIERKKRETRRDIADDETFRSYEKGRARKL